MAKPAAIERRCVRHDRAHDVKPRRHNDPSTCEFNFSELDIEFAEGMELYKRLYHRPFPTCHEILEVLHVLGYRRTIGPIPLEELTKLIRGLPTFASNRATAPPTLPVPPAVVAPEVAAVPPTRRLPQHKPPPPPTKPVCTCCQRRPQHARQLCAACYMRGHARVQAGRTTWEEFVAARPPAAVRPGAAT